MTVFVIYSSIPIKYVPNRNDDMIFNQMKWMPSINMFINGAWMYVFTTNTIAGFIISMFIIFIMLYTDLKCMVIAGKNKKTKFEYISVWVPWSLYSGWVSAATILNISFVLKSNGMTEYEEWNKPTDP